MKKHLLFVSLLLSLAGAAAACGDEGGGSGGGSGGGAGGGAGGGSGGGAGGGGPMNDTACFGDGVRDVVAVSDAITADTTWDADTIYCLDDLIFVSANLTIEAGTLIQGTADSALIITRDGTIDAVGTADAPIVFTSSEEPGNRQTSDWKGLALLGDARVNKGTCVHDVSGTETEADASNCVADSAEYYFRGNVEGIDPTDANGYFGGLDDSHECGHLAYVRVEFAGAPFTTDDELNGITLAGCGDETLLEYVQVHNGFDDGIEHFGGAANMHHIVISGAGDDGLDWDLGWRGKVQFLVVHSPAGASEDPRAFESDSLSSTDMGIVVSDPTIYNATLVGGETVQAMMLREGTRGELRNFVVTGFGVGGVTLNHANTLANWDDDSLVLSNTFFHDNLNVGTDTASNDRLTDAAALNVTDEDPMLGSTDITAPDYVPANTALAGQATPPNDGFFDTAATYAGAFAPNAATDWTEGWTSFPED